MKSLVISALLGLTAPQVHLKGACPKVTDSWDDSINGKLDISRLSGSWRIVYDHHNQENMDCMSIKLE